MFSALEVVLVMAFEIVTDAAFVPPLLLLWRSRRHFELYVGVFQLSTGVLYNFCNALNVTLFLTERQWHGLNNILTTTYVLLLLIHMQCNADPSVDAALRYCAFTAVWIAQLKDDYWNPSWTALVVLIFCLMPICKFGGAMQLPPYDAEKLCKGLIAGASSAVCFLLGLDTTIDPFRVFHGLSQAMVGFTFFYLWQLVPLSLAVVKKTSGWSDSTQASRHSGSSDETEQLAWPPLHSLSSETSSGVWTPPAGKGMGRVMSYDHVRFAHHRRCPSAG